MLFPNPWAWIYASWRIPGPFDRVFKVLRFQVRTRFSWEFAQRGGLEYDKESTLGYDTA